MDRERAIGKLGEDMAAKAAAIHNGAEVLPEGQHMVQLLNRMIWAVAEPVG